MHRGCSIEQSLGRAGDEGAVGIQWVEIVPSGAGYRIVLHVCCDVGGEDFCDLVEFPPLEEGDEEGFGKLVAVAPDARQALSAAGAVAGAAADRWVNQGMAGDEYLDYVRAGRPSATAP